MAEGIDNAADAFRASMNAPETLPVNRGSDGRFQQVARPESLFSPRQIEGDPLTGDTRDGGEDARLARRQEELANGEPFDSESRQLRGRDLQSTEDQEHRRTAHEPTGDEDERSGSGQDIEGV